MHVCTHGQLFLNFESHLSTQHKESVIKALVKPGEDVSTTTRTKWLRGCVLIFKVNNNPSRFIHVTRRKMRANDGTRGQREIKPLVVLPYVKAWVTEKVTCVSKPYARVLTKPGKSLRNLLVNAKHKRDIFQSTQLVYQYECQCKKVYPYRRNM